MRILILVGYQSARNELLIERLRDTSMLVTRTLEVSSAMLWLTSVRFDVVVLETKLADGRGADLMYAAHRLPPRPGVVPAQRETTAVPATVAPRTGATAALTSETGASATAPFLAHRPQFLAHARFPAE